MLAPTLRAYWAQAGRGRPYPPIQFDFIKNGANLGAAPFPEGHLWDITFTADLRKAFTLFKPRADGLSTASAAQKYKMQSRAVAPSSPQKIVDDLYQDWASEPELIASDLWYERMPRALIAAVR